MPRRPFFMNNIFYTPSSRITEQRMELAGQEAHHAANVMRYSDGDQLVVVDGKGTFYRGTVIQINDDSLVARVKDRWFEAPPDPELDLGLALIKKRDRLEFAIEKAVEMGVRRFYLFPSRHAVKTKVRTNRLQTIAMQAMKQSLRAYKPEIRVAGGLAEVMEEASSRKMVVAHQGEQDIPDLLHTLKQESHLMLFIGPEGGFTSEEVKKIKDRGGKAISLGPKRLRAETAALKLVAQLT